MKPTVAPTTIDLHLGGIRLHGVTAGSGPLCLMFHGITGNGYVFAPMIDRLAPRLRCISFDQRGHGRSGKPAHGYAAHDFARDIAAIIAKLDAGPALLIGHSLGARNALVAGSTYPASIAAVVAIDFTPYIETEVFDALDARVAGGAQVFADWDAAKAYLVQRYPKLPAEAIERRARYGMIQCAGGLRPLADPDAVRQISTGLREDLAAPLQRLQVPTLLIRGAESKLVSTAAWERTRALRPDLRAVEIPGVDHYVQEEAPQAVVDHTLAFWQSLHTQS